MIREIPNEVIAKLFLIATRPVMKATLDMLEKERRKMKTQLGKQMYTMTEVQLLAYQFRVVQAILGVTKPE